MSGASHWIRQAHRWVSIAFTLAVIANFVALSQGEPPAWVTYSPLLPLALLLFSGLYLLVLPYASKRRVEARGSAREQNVEASAREQNGH